MDYLTKILRTAAAFVAALTIAALLPEASLAQVVTQQPQFAAPRAVLDLGNGPTEIMPLLGNGFVFTSSGSGLGSGTTTAITLTATPTVNPPCVGCQITGSGITGTTLITAYNGTTGITVNTSQTISASTPACVGRGVPGFDDGGSGTAAGRLADAAPAGTGPVRPRRAVLHRSAYLCVRRHGSGDAVRQLRDRRALS
jgi:hypothetical protein